MFWGFQMQWKHLSELLKWILTILPLFTSSSSPCHSNIYCISRVSRVYLAILFYTRLGSWEFQLKKLKATRKFPNKNESQGAVGQRTLGDAEKLMFIKVKARKERQFCGEEHPICRRPLLYLRSCLDLLVGCLGSL